MDKTGLRMGMIAPRRKPIYIYVRLALMQIGDDYERTIRADILRKRTAHTTISE